MDLPAVGGRVIRASSPIQLRPGRGASVIPTREPIGELSPAPRLETVSSFERIWRRVSWEETLKIAGSGLPFIEGMPVIGVLLQPGSGGERPTIIVAQQDGTGELIQSIEGPVAKVFDLLKRQSAPDVFASSASRTPPDYVRNAGGVLDQSHCERAISQRGSLSTHPVHLR